MRVNEKKKTNFNYADKSYDVESRYNSQLYTCCQGYRKKYSSDFDQIWIEILNWKTSSKSAHQVKGYEVTHIKIIHLDWEAPPFLEGGLNGD